MNNAVKNAFIFIAGAAIGSVVTTKLLKTKYEQFAQAEIDSVKEVYSHREVKLTEEIDEAHEKMRENRKNEDPLVGIYKKTVDTLGYTNYSDISKKEEKKAEHHDPTHPYVISPEDFGEYDEYDRISLIYYSDKILAENDEIVDDVENTVGFDSLNHFGDFEDDAVHVRNDKLHCDYEILRVDEKYSDSVRKGPYRTEV